MTSLIHVYHARFVAEHPEVDPRMIELGTTFNRALTRREEREWSLSVIADAFPTMVIVRRDERKWVDGRKVPVEGVPTCEIPLGNRPCATGEESVVWQRPLAMGFLTWLLERDQIYPVVTNLGGLYVWAVRRSTDPAVVR